MNKASVSNKEILLDTEGVEVKTMKIEDQNISYFSNKGVIQIYQNYNTYNYALISSIEIEELLNSYIQELTLLNRDNFINKYINKTNLVFLSVEEKSIPTNNINNATIPVIPASIATKYLIQVTPLNKEIDITICNTKYIQLKF